MIWNLENISSTVNSAEISIGKYIADQSIPAFVDSSVFRVGIIGGGPKGLFALDNLLNSLASQHVEEEIQIFWFNSDINFGCGPNFDPNQPDYLLINTCIGQVDAWSRVEVGIFDDDLPDLVRWIAKNNSTSEQVQATDFASRALVGRYLQEVTSILIHSVPPQVRLFLMVNTVLGIKENGEFTLNLCSGNFQFPMNNILLTTGHCYSNPSLITGMAKNSSYWSNTYITDAWKLDQLEKIGYGNLVGIAGMGLTFIDIALHLTEGRGGIFDESGDYQPSGNEPIIFPFSRSGQPILPRSAAFGSKKYKLRFLNKDWLENILDISIYRKVDFSKEILPVLEREISYAYYSTLLGTENLKAINLFISACAPDERFDMHHLLFGRIGNGENRHESVTDFLKNAMTEALKGEKNSPLIAAMAVWREAVPLIGEIYAHGGLSGVSHRELDVALLGALNRTSFGPPVENMQKILALAKVGIIRFDLGEQVEVSVLTKEKFHLTSGNKVQPVDFLIDARVARPKMENDNSSLYRQLLEANLIEPYSNEGYMPGCVSMDPFGQTTVRLKNSAALFFYGSNTEGVLLDNDSLSRIRNNLASHWAKFTMNQFFNKKHIQNELSF